MGRTMRNNNEWRENSEKHQESIGEGLGRINKT